MFIGLESRDLLKLSASTRVELAALVREMCGAPDVDAPHPPEGLKIGRKTLADLNVLQFTEFMNGVGEVVEAGLRYIASKDGHVDCDELYQESSTHISIATTKRARTVTGRNDVVLMGWDSGTREYIVSPATLKAMQEYFKND